MSAQHRPGVATKVIVSPETAVSMGNVDEDIVRTDSDDAAAFSGEADAEPVLTHMGPSVGLVCVDGGARAPFRVDSSVNFECESEDIDYDLKSSEFKFDPFFSDTNVKPSLPVIWTFSQPKGARGLFVADYGAGFPGSGDRSSEKALCAIEPSTTPKRITCADTEDSTISVVEWSELAIRETNTGEQECVPQAFITQRFETWGLSTTGGVLKDAIPSGNPPSAAWAATAGNPFVRIDWCRLAKAQ